MNIDLQVFSAINNAADRIYTNTQAYRIQGKVMQLSIPLPCRVRLFEKMSGRMILDTKTDINGNYAFENISKSKYFIVAHHPASQYNAVIQDNVVPK